MASGATIRVCVLEGQYAQLSNLGFPVSLAVELQQGGLFLDNAKWSSRLSDVGFSVSFFWPIARTTQRRRHRRRRKPRTNPNSGNFRTTTIVTNQERICPIPRKGTLVPLLPVLTDAHPSLVATSAAVDAEVPSLSFSSKYPPMTVGCDNSVGSDVSVSSEVSVSSKSEPTALFDSTQSNSPPQISLPPPSSQDSPNLLQCLDVMYESREQEPGVSYRTRDGKEEWTPVVRRRRKGRRHVSGSSESDSDGSKVDVSCSRLVRYEVRDETPGLTVFRRGPATWIPIKAVAVNLEEPIAARTRSKLNT